MSDINQIEQESMENKKKGPRCEVGPQKDKSTIQEFVIFFVNNYASVKVHQSICMVFAINSKPIWTSGLGFRTVLLWIFHI